jgi:ATPase subunit of ABC transporter with duplicated ATPase domains
MSALVRVQELSCRTSDGRPLFDDLTLAFGAERTGLVGRNGAGKTTLLRLILGELQPQAGGVRRTGRVGVLRQALAPPPGASVAALMGFAEPLERLRRIAAGLGDEDDLAQADWTLEDRIQAALADVGLAGLDPARPADSLSGGQLTRAALAGLLAQAPEMLLLDEPTNNLDAEARALVARVLEGWRGGAVVVSHDRALLRRMDRIVELGGLGARVYGGGYDLYLEHRSREEAAARRELEAAEQAVLTVERELQTARERKARRDGAGRRARARGDQPKLFLDAQAERAENSTGRLGRLSERRRLQAAETLDAARGRVERVDALGVRAPSCGLPTGRTVLVLDGAGFAWPGSPPVLQGLDLRISGPERVAVVGPNGSGKTTLLKLIMGTLEPTWGQVARGVRALQLDQRTALLQDSQSLVENFRRLNPGATANAAHAALAQFLFRASAAQRPAGELSGGERLRAALACALSAPEPPQLLVLDEPTNHLDLESVQAIEQALQGYDGALVVVSHDEDFLAALGIARRVRLGGDP